VALLEQLVSLLAAGDTLSGRVLASRLGVSRATVWNAVQSLQAMGLDIYAIRGTGYRIPKPFELLNREQILASLNNRVLQDDLTLSVLWEIESTNTYLQKQLPARGICVAECQSAGRGRRGRRWISPLGGNIYLSMSWSYQSAPMALNGLSLACAVAVVNALREYGTKGVSLKWPNDIQWHGRKLAGLMLELQGEAAGGCSVIVGIGVNVNLSHTQADAIDQPWISLDQIQTNELPRRNYLVSLLVNNVADVLRDFDRKGFKSYADAWRQYDAFPGRQVVISQSAGQTAVGIYRGIDEDGLLLLDCDGEIKKFSSGDVSVRRIQSEPA